MEKTLIVYYTNSGMADKVARDVNKLLPKADMDKIGYSGRNYKEYKKISVFVKQFFTPSKIGGDTHNPAEYDKIVFVFPVWSGKPAPVMRAYLQKYAQALKGKPYSIIAVAKRDDAKAADFFTQTLGAAPSRKIALTPKQIDKSDYKLNNII